MIDSPVAVAVLATLLAVYLTVVLPALGASRYRELARRVAAEPDLRLRAYQRGMVHGWLLVGIAVALVLVAGAPPAALGLTTRVHARGWMLPALAGLLVIGAVVVLVLRRRPRLAERLMRPAAALLPRTPAERRLFVAVAVSAGVTEEVLFRGFLMLYLVDVFPEVTLRGAVVLSAALFGLAHAYQGALGVVLTGCAGFALGELYALSGSLLLPVALHAMVDLRVLLLVPRRPVGA